MSFDKNYVLQELRNGRNYEDIMDEISRVLNEASQEYEHEQEQKSNNNNQIADMEEIIDLIYDYCIEYYGTSNEKINRIDELFKNEKAEEWIKIIDSLVAVINSLEDFTKFYDSSIKSQKIDVDSIIEKFLKTLH